jgi:hypothetical protein
MLSVTLTRWYGEECVGVPSVRSNKPDAPVFALGGIDADMDGLSVLNTPPLPMWTRLLHTWSATLIMVVRLAPIQSERLLAFPVTRPRNAILWSTTV